MNSDDALEKAYKELCGDNPVTIFVFPAIRYAYKRSDYTYLLYRALFKKPKFRIENLSVLTHWKPVLKQRLEHLSILHYHWLELTNLVSIIRFLYQWLMMILFQHSGGKIAWTIHNKMPPDGKYKRLNYYLRRWMARKSDLLLVHCKAAIPEFAGYYNTDESKFRVVPHPDFPSMLMPRAAAVESLNHRFNLDIKVQDRLFLMFGHISPYKQIEQVCEIFMDEPIHKKLIIAGPVKKGQLKYYKRLRKIASRNKNIILIPRFIKEEYVPEFFNAADYLVFNFREVMSSGGTALARSYDKMMILPNQGCMENVEKEQALFFDSQDELREVIQNH